METDRTEACAELRAHMMKSEVYCRQALAEAKHELQQVLQDRARSVGSQFLEGKPAPVAQPISHANIANIMPVFRALARGI